MIFGSDLVLPDGLARFSPPRDLPLTQGAPLPACRALRVPNLVNRSTVIRHVPSSAALRVESIHLVRHAHPHDRPQSRDPCERRAQGPPFGHQSHEFPDNIHGRSIQGPAMLAVAGFLHLKLRVIVALSIAANGFRCHRSERRTVLSGELGVHSVIRRTC
jgi:hypothetical protein